MGKSKTSKKNNDYLYIFDRLYYISDVDELFLIYFI